MLPAGLPVDAILNMLLYVLGPAFVALFVYMKGRSSGAKKAEDAYLEASRQLNESVKEAQIKNQALEVERNNAIDAIRNAKSGADVDKLWRKNGWGPKGVRNSPHSPKNESR